MKKILSIFIITLLLFQTSSVFALTYNLNNSVDINTAKTTALSNYQTQFDALEVNQSLTSTVRGYISSINTYRIYHLQITRSTGTILDYLICPFTNNDLSLTQTGIQANADYVYLNFNSEITGSTGYVPAMMYDFNDNTWGVYIDNSISLYKQSGTSPYTATFTLTELTDSYSDLLSTLNPSPGFNEFIIYEMQGGSKVAEYFKSFPLVTFVSDSVRGDDFAKWKWSGNGDREVYFCSDDETWDLVSKTSNSSFTGYFTGLEIKIIASSVQLHDDQLNTYGGSLGGDSSTDPVDLDPDSPTSIRITSPLDGLETTKTSAYFEILVNTPTTVKAGLLNMATYTASMPLIYFENNNITNPDNNLGYLPWTKKITYFTENNTFWESDDEYEDFELKSVTSNILGNNRTEYVFKVVCNLAVGNNDFNINVKPMWHSLSSTGALAYPKVGDIITKNLTVVRVASVDSDNNGVDDNTGETINSDPYNGNVINDDGNTQWVNDGDPVTSAELDATKLTSVFKDMLSVILSFTSNIGGIFAFLPPEILSLIVLSMSVGIFLFIFKAILGR